MLIKVRGAPVLLEPNLKHHQKMVNMKLRAQVGLLGNGLYQTRRASSLHRAVARSPPSVSCCEGSLGCSDSPCRIETPVNGSLMAQPGPCSRRHCRCIGRM